MSGPEFCSVVDERTLNSSFLDKGPGIVIFYMKAPEIVDFYIRRPGKIVF